MTSSNGLDKETQILNGQRTRQKGDTCELQAAAYFSNLGYRIYHKMSGPIDLVLVHHETGETRYIDVKYKNTRQGTKTKGQRINRTVTSSLKKYIKIEIVYVDEEGKIELPFANGREEWSRKYKIAIDKRGRYTGKVVSR
tara:strand:+ start:52 stop:471 length:420 start_codon:yes stop_codon:yes gene_type:complete